MIFSIHLCAIKRFFFISLMLLIWIVTKSLIFLAGCFFSTRTMDNENPRQRKAVYSSGQCVVLDCVFNLFFFLLVLLFLITHYKLLHCIQQCIKACEINHCNRVSSKKWWRTWWAAEWLLGSLAGLLNSLTFRQKKKIWTYNTH